MTFDNKHSESVDPDSPSPTKLVASPAPTKNPWASVKATTDILDLQSSTAPEDFCTILEQEQVKATNLEIAMNKPLSHVLVSVNKLHPFYFI